MDSLQGSLLGGEATSQNEPPTPEAVARHYPPEVLEPKVFAEYTPRPGKVPRKIVIERAKRQYWSLDIEQLLAENGLDYRLPVDPDYGPFLPLELFDNEDHDVFTPQQWMAKGQNLEEPSPLPARAARFRSDGSAFWEYCNVTEYNEETLLFTVEWFSGGTDLLPRIHILFLAEDPLRLCARILEAHQRRHEAELQLRYNLYVDSMPTDDVPTLTEEAQARIIEIATMQQTKFGRTTQTRYGKPGYARATQALALPPGAHELADDNDEDAELTPFERKRRLAELDVIPHLREINAIFSRGINKMIFDKCRRDGTQAELFASVDLPPLEPPREVPWKGTYPTPPHNYQAAKAAFSFQSFMTKPQVVRALFCVREECNNVVAQRLFYTNLRKTMRLEDFFSIQQTTCASVVSMLRKEWMESLCEGIKASLDTVGKGWFNLQETNQDVYEVSKLKKFMNMITFMMQDSVRFLIQYSIQEFTRFIEDVCNIEVRVHSPSHVEVIEQSSEHVLRRAPLFMADMEELPDHTLGLATALGQFQELPLQLFDTAIESCQNLPRIERQILGDLFRRQDQSHSLLKTLHPDESIATDLRTRIAAALEKALQPLQAYLAVYDPYTSLLQTDLNEFIRQYESEEHTVEEFQRDIKQHMQEAVAIETSVPTEIDVGLLLVQCGRIRTALIQRHNQMAQMLLDLLAKTAITQAESILDQFEAIRGNMTERPHTVQELCDKREYLEQVPTLTRNLRPDLQQMLSTYNVLEAFHYQFLPDDYSKRWVSYGFPLRIQEEMADVQSTLARDQKRFEETMVADQERLNRQIQDVSSMVSRLNRHTDLTRVEDYALEIERLQVQLKDYQSQAKDFTTHERLLSRDVTEYPVLRKTQREFERYASLWITARKWTQWRKEWKDGPFNQLDAVDMEENLTKAHQTIVKCIKLFKDIPEVQGVAEEVKESMKELLPHMPLILALRNKGMKDRHWNSILMEIGFDIRPQESTTLVDMLSMNLEEHKEAIMKVCDTAAKEYQLEENLARMQEDWADVSFEIVDYKETRTCVLRGHEDIQEMLDQHLLITQAMTFSPFREPLIKPINEWLSTLKYISLLIEEWIGCQKQWIYLEPVFSSEDIQRQLGFEYKRFQTVDRTWRRLMGQAKQVPHVLTYSTPDKLQSFQESRTLLEAIQRGLDSHLESKRKAFPRFYFLSSQELLDILSQTRDPTKVQNYLGTCFEAIDKLTFEEDLTITQMISKEKEIIPFLETFQPDGNVEHWLTRVEQVMQASVRDHLIRSLKHYTEVPRTEWVLNWPGQIVLAVSQIYWTRMVEEALEQGTAEAVRGVWDRLKQQLLDLTVLVRGQLTNLQRLTMSALITLDVHSRDVTSNLVQAGVTDASAFEWISQLRYYWEDDDCHVKMVQTDFKYAYEYLGNSSRLVITPLTDRIYMTLMGAIHLHLGGAPAGPAGTGKTETVKDLAKAVAVKCVVFNCSESLKINAMSRFFKGLAMTGSWSCFDEFNRIDIEVLSVIAQQISTIQHGIMENMPKFRFEDDEIPLVPTCATFITMNPGYAGRTELPDNLKALFRPVACMVPDYALIAQIRLFSFGFSQGEVLSKKMAATFKLSSEQLSKQSHYDFGMRAVNTVISAAGNLKRNMPDFDEELLLLRALRDTNVPKFLANDLPLFNGIISDLFPGKKPMVVDYGRLQEALIEQCNVRGLQPRQEFLHKCIQLWETIILRHGLMLVGPSGGGKTSCLKTLSAAVTSLKGTDPDYENVKEYWLNPKSIPMEELYGALNRSTNEWKNGILTILMREYAKDGTTDKQWIIFDGPVDALWIEDMNTVLDDNKKLCLSSGEIIPLTPYMRMIFEVEDLRVASPATVSRCGMVYMEPESTIGIQALIQSWVLTFPEVFNDFRERIAERTLELLLPTIEYVRGHCSEPVPTVDTNLVQSMFNLVECLMKPFIPTEETEDEPPKLDEFARSLDSFLVTACIWSCGASTNPAGRVKFNEHIRALIAEKQFEVEIPTQGTVYDYHYNDADHTWVEWMDTIPDYHIRPKTPFHEIIVPTADSVRNTYFIKLLVENSKNVMCVGATGTAKSVTIQQYLLKQMPQNYVPIMLGFSARTSAGATQRQIDKMLERHRTGVFGPPPGQRFVLFIDDFNMPQPEKYGAQPPVELVRQFIDHRGWYFKKDLRFIYIEDVQLVTAMGFPGGGRHQITNRLMRRFNMLMFTELSGESLHRIFATILNSFVTSSGFSRDIAQLTHPLVDATIEIYNTISQELLPIPTKPHYTFNLRDLSKVFQGFLGCYPPDISNVNDFLRLWVHEAMRVFHDRLVDHEDREWFVNLLRVQLRKHYNMSWDQIESSTDLLYGNLLSLQSDTKPYVQIKDNERLGHILDEALDDYAQSNTQGASMDLVMFRDAVQHLARISRIIHQPYGNALLLGVGGSGRQSLTRLAAHMAEYRLKQIEIKKNYGVREWHDDLKDILREAGFGNDPVVFLFSDTQIVDPSFLQDINNILNSGEVPNIFDENDLEAIYSTMKPYLAGAPPTKINLFAQFVKRVREHIHIVLCMSPTGEVFRGRLRMFPSLVTCCTIDWFDPWPDNALRSVADFKLKDTDLGENDEIRGPVVDMCVFIHQSVERATERYIRVLRRHNAVTPMSFLELISTFKRILDKKRSQLEMQRDRLAGGLDKMAKTKEEVAKNEARLTEFTPILKRMQKEVDEMMVSLGRDREAASVTRNHVQKEEQDATEQAAKCKAIKEDAESDLAQALPELEGAQRALKQLRIDMITEVARYTNISAGVRLVIEAMCIVLRIAPKRVDDPDNIGKKKDDYWSAARSVLMNASQLLQQLLHFNFDTMTQAQIDKLAKYIDNPSFTPEVVAHSSVACKTICEWIRAAYRFYHVNLTVIPKKQALAAAEAELERTLKELEQKRAHLATVVENIERLERTYEEEVAKKADLERQANECTTQLDRADRLLGGLGGESERWKESVVEMDARETNLVGDVLVAAGGVTYLGPFTSAFRNDLMREWRDHLLQLNLPHSHNCNIRSTLEDPVQTRQWTLDDLPSDTLSIENALILHYAKRWPLCIDPQGQANKWIKNMEKEKLDTIKLSQDFLRTLETDIRFGKPVLLENIREELDPSLEPILSRSTFAHKGTVMIRLGDTLLNYNQDFHFYVTTKLPNPVYTPETSVKVTLLNFTATLEGLEDQLLATVVVKERPDLQEQKTQLMISNAKMRAELKQLEDDILRLLSETLNPLEDETLINRLAESKKVSNEIAEKVAAAEQTERDIDRTRAEYIPVARRAAILFFCVADLALIDPMYQYSLQWYLGLYDQAIENAAKNSDLQIRLQTLIDDFTYLLYQNVCRSLFVRHKLMFSFLMVTRLMMSDDRIDPVEFRFLVAAGTSPEETENPASDWLTTRAWKELQALATLPKFEGLSESVTSKPDLWKQYFDSGTCFSDVLPDGWHDRLDQFQRMLVLRCLRPDKMSEAIQDFVKNNFGKKFVQPPNFNLPLSYRDSTATTPLIFILSSGNNPKKQLEQFASEMRMSKKLRSCSLGQGQGEIARQLIETGQEAGHWVLLENCHLASSWMSCLEALVEEFRAEKVHRDFRLWLTSMPSASFPVMILQNGIKMTNEPPKGLQSNLQRTYDGFNNAFLQQTTKPSIWRKFLFSLSFFHAVIQERRKFGPLGWNIRYEFTDDDLSVCVRQLRLFLDTYEDVPYQVLKFLFGEINYGGRVTDSKDQRLLGTILHDFINPEVLEIGYAFSPSGKYRQIEGEEHKDYTELLASFDLNAHPEVFGLHENADITCAQADTYEMFDCILSLQPRASAGSGKKREDVIDETAASILSRLPKPWDVDAIMAKYPTVYEESMNTVLVQEVTRFNRLLETIDEMLRELQRALKGLVVLSDALEATANALFDNIVPDKWAEVAYPSLKPLSAWVSDLVERCAFIEKWIQNGTPACFWISGFFFPQAFLTGTLQNYARNPRHIVPIDSITFSTVVIDTPHQEITEKPEDGCYIYGLYIEGARWDPMSKSLAESRPKELFTSMPVIHLLPQVDFQEPESGFYHCPIYKTLARAGELSTTGHSTNYVLSVHVPSSQPDSHWIKRGVALLCALAY